MRFFRPVLALLFAAVAWAGPNPFNVPQGGYSFQAGSTVDLTWTPTTSGTVTLLLRSGNPGDLTPGTTIVSSIANSGSYEWSIPADTVEATDYTIEIQDDSDTSQVNYTPPVTILSTNTVPSSSGTASATTPGTGTPAPTPGSMSSSLPAATPTASSASGSAPATTKKPGAHHASASTSNNAVATSTVTNMAPAGVMAARVQGAVAGLVAVGVGAVAVL